MYDLQQMLLKADPNLEDSARNALLSRQVMKDVLPILRFKLLKHNPTPTLKEMRGFVHRFHATQHSHSNSHTSASCTPTAPPQENLEPSIVQLTAAVAELTTQQSKIQASVKAMQPQQ